MPIETHPFDAAEFLGRPEAQAELLADAFASGEAGYIKLALGTVARAQGMTALAEEVGLSRQGLYKALSEDGDPKLSTLVEVARALGFRLTVEPIAAE